MLFTTYLINQHKNTSSSLLLVLFWLQSLHQVDVGLEGKGRHFQKLLIWFCLYFFLHQVSFQFPVLVYKVVDKIYELLSACWFLEVHSCKAFIDAALPGAHLNVRYFAIVHGQLMQLLFGYVKVEIWNSNTILKIQPLPELSLLLHCFQFEGQNYNFLWLIISENKILVILFDVFLSYFRVFKFN